MQVLRQWPLAVTARSRGPPERLVKNSATAHSGFDARQGDRKCSASSTRPRAGAPARAGPLRREGHRLPRRPADPGDPPRPVPPRPTPAQAQAAAPARGSGLAPRGLPLRAPQHGATRLHFTCASRSAACSAPGRSQRAVAEPRDHRLAQPDEDHALSAGELRGASTPARARSREGDHDNDRADLGTAPTAPRPHGRAGRHATLCWRARSPRTLGAHAGRRGAGERWIVVKMSDKHRHATAAPVAEAAPR